MLPIQFDQFHYNRILCDWYAVCPERAQHFGGNQQVFRMRHCDLLWYLQVGTFGMGHEMCRACARNFLIDFFRFRRRLEYFSVMFNVSLALIYLFTDGLRLICWHIPEQNVRSFRVCVTLKLLLWSFVFLILLPVKFLMPTLFGRKFYLWLNSFFLLWYGSCVWNSVSQIFLVIIYLLTCTIFVDLSIILNIWFQPILQYMYHQIYHTNNISSDCMGGSSVSRYGNNNKRNQVVIPIYPFFMNSSNLYSIQTPPPPFCLRHSEMWQ